MPYIRIWLTARDLIAVTPESSQAQNIIARYDRVAFAFAIGGITLYFAGLMYAYFTAFRTAANIHKQGVAHVMKAVLGFFENKASDLIRGRLDAAATDTETPLAHNLADMVGAVVLFLPMPVLMFLFDWRTGATYLLMMTILSLPCSPDGRQNAKLIAEYQAAQDHMTKTSAEYVRDIPVVKISNR